MSVYFLKHLTRKFGERTVLNIDSLTIEKGKIYSLLGPNGTGKTTLLNILALLAPPTSGEITFFGKKVVFSERSLHRLRRRVVIVDQNPILFTTTVHKNLEFGLKIRRIPKKERQRLIAESLEMVGLKHLEHQPAHKLSGGETQRIVLARALALSPDVILCDEPTANVDAENQSVIVDILKQINDEKGITLIFTSHNPQPFETLPHQSFYLENGKISAQSYKNIFSATMTPTGPESSKCRIGNLFEIELPVNKVGPARIRIDPSLVVVNGHPQPNDSQADINFKIIQIAFEKESVQLTVENQIKLAVNIPLKSYRESRFLVGDDINLSIQPKAIVII